MKRGRAAILTAAGVLFAAFFESLAAQPERLGNPAYDLVQMTRGPQNHLLVSAQVNGRPAMFLVDTGADVSFIRRDRAQAFGIAAEETEVRRRG
ncbi:MAG TPA: retropepsin-like aspartic protease, partial [Chthoniobacterales bacterium]|nr:retropepsin-like aspartic protease [Chthoniobacterales bacterium]